LKRILILSLFLSLIITTGNCSNKKPDINSSADKAQSEKKTEVRKIEIDENKLTQRAALTALLKKPELGLYAYEPFTLPLEDFELEDLNGKMVKLSSFIGNVIFLNFWATWCPPCRAEMPSMQRLSDALAGKKFVIIAVDLQDEKEAVAKFMKDNNLNFTVLLDKTGAIGGKYGARSIPTSYIFDSLGYVVTATAGSREWDEPQFMEIFNMLLAERN